jgi:hypothetical protein
VTTAGGYATGGTFDGTSVASPPEVFWQALADTTSGSSPGRSLAIAPRLSGTNTFTSAPFIVAALCH